MPEKSNKRQIKILILIFFVLTILILPISGWVPVQKISTPPDNIDNPNWECQIAVDPSGNSYITWYSNDRHDWEIY